MMAALTPLPVIGVPCIPKGHPLDGMDALLSIVQVLRPLLESAVCTCCMSGPPLFLALLALCCFDVQYQRMQLPRHTHLQDVVHAPRLLDSRGAELQMPRGVPVATVAIGNAANAGLLALRILATSQPQLQESLLKYQVRPCTPCGTCCAPAGPAHAGQQPASAARTSAPLPGACLHSICELLRACNQGRLQSTAAMPVAAGCQAQCTALLLADSAAAGSVSWSSAKVPLLQLPGSLP